MTNSQAKSELMQIYGMLSEEKKQALDVLMAQAEKTCDIEKSNFDVRQYKLDTDTAYECGYNAGLQAQADGEYKSNKELLCDSCYRKIAGCQAKFHNPHPVDHCIEYKPIEKQADGEYISREAVIDIIEDVCPIYGNDYRYILREKVNELPIKAIPSAEPQERSDKE